MCLRTIKNMSLERQLSRCEQEVKSLKTTQRYGMVQARTFSSSSINESSIGTYISSVGITVYGLHLVLIYTGEYEQKTVIGDFVWDIDTAENNAYEMITTTSPKKNELQFDIYVQDLYIAVPFDVDPTHSTPFSFGGYVRSNQPGELRVVTREGIDVVI